MVPSPHNNNNNNQAAANNNNNNNNTIDKLFVTASVSFLLSTLIMGFLDRFRGGARSLSIGDDAPSSSFVFLEASLVEGTSQEIQTQLVFMLTFVGLLLGLRFWIGRSLRSLSGQHTLNLHHLNDCCMYKEVFLAYLNAAILEPVLAIGGMQEVEGLYLVINIAELMGMCWWIWLVTDAFNFEDVMQMYKFHYEFREDYDKDRKTFSFLRLTDTKESARSERQGFLGSMKRDVALWGMMGSIAAAWLPGVIRHRDVVHSHVVVTLWAILHHSARRATTWGISYFYSFLFPSAALMPLEYCLPLMDTADVVEDLDFVSSYREYVVDRTGVELMIEL